MLLCFQTQKPKFANEDKHHLKKSADRKAKTRRAFVPLTGLICAIRSADFLRWCLSSERNFTHAQSLFLFPIVFGVNLIHFFMRRTVQPKIRLFVSVLRSPVTPFDRSKTKNANCLKERIVFGNRKCGLSALLDGRN